MSKYIDLFVLLKTDQVTSILNEWKINRNLVSKFKLRLYILRIYKTLMENHVNYILYNVENCLSCSFHCCYNKRLMIVSRKFLLPSIKFLSRGLINLVFSKINIKNFVAITSQMKFPFLIIIHDVAFGSLYELLNIYFFIFVLIMLLLFCIIFVVKFI